MGKRLAIVLAAVEANFLNDFQGAEHCRKHRFGNECLTEKVAYHKVDRGVEKDFANLDNRRVGQVDQSVFEKLQISHANGADDQIGGQAV